MLELADAFDYLCQIYSSFRKLNLKMSNAVAAQNAAPVKITVAGKISDPAFHKCVAAVKYLQEANPGAVTGECLHFFETQWEEYIKKTANRLKGIFY